MSKIVLGKADGRDIKLDLDVLLRTHLLIWASTGGGKSWLIRRLAEQLFGKVPVIIVDREGEFSTLREKLGFVLVGQGGETPADVRSAKMVAEKLLELRASAVCDLYELKHETRHEWVKAFVNGLVDAPKRLWGPTVIIIDEAHLFCPEKGQGESVAYGAVADLAGQGRKRGFGIVLATQRLSKLSKNATGEMFNQAAGPTARQADRDRAAYEMGISDRKEIKEFSETLRRLENGNFFFQGRAVAMDRVLVKVGSVETTHPEAGSTKFKAGPPPAPEEIKALLPKLADLPKAAEDKARTEGELRAEIRQLKQMLRSAQHDKPPVRTDTQTVHVADPRAIERAVKEAAVAWQKAIAERDAYINKFKALVKTLNHQTSLLDALLHDAPIGLPKIQPKHIQLASKPLEPRHIPSRPLVPARTFPDGDEAGSTPLPSSERTVLRAIAQYEGGVERNHLSILTGYKRSTRDAYVARLRTKNMVEDRGGKIVPTELGLSALGAEFEPLPQGEELQRYWLARLPKGEKEIFEILLAAGGELVSREILTEQTGYKRSTRDAYLARMAAKKIVESVGRGEVKAAPLLFMD
jgi:hypothetical protein